MTDYAADDTKTIAGRLKEIEDERAEVRRQNDPEHATGENLERIAADWGVTRTSSGESDYTMRNRLQHKIRERA